MMNINRAKLVDTDVVVKLDTTGRIISQPVADVDSAVRLYHEWKTAPITNRTDVTVIVASQFMPDPDEDETFFYASVKAARGGKVWCEIKHQFVERSYLSDLLGGCFDTGNPADDAQFWSEAVANVYADIQGIIPVTGDSDGSAEYAIVRDDDLAEACRENGGLLVTQIGVDPEDGTAIYRIEMAEWDDPDGEWDDPDYEEPEDILAIEGKASEVKPFVKALYRAVRKGRICWSGYCDAPRLNPDRRYRVTLWKEKWGYSLTTEEVRNLTDPSGDFFYENLSEYEALVKGLDWGEETTIEWDGEVEPLIEWDDDEVAYLKSLAAEDQPKWIPVSSRGCRRKPTHKVRLRPDGNGVVFHENHLWCVGKNGAAGMVIQM